MSCTMCYAPAILALLIVVTLIILDYLKPKKKSIENKHVVVTGGSSGIGKAVAIQAAKRGAHVTIIARQLNKLNEALVEIKKFKVNESQKFQAVSCDVSNHDIVERTINDLEDTVGPIFMLVNCAGMAICGILEEMSVSDIKTLIDINFLGTLYPTKLIVPKMKGRKEGIVVITASQGALLGVYGLATYSSTKFALRGLAEALDMEVRPFNISVTVSLPPDTDTPGLENENKNKPIETHLISESGGLVQPEEVAEQMMKDALNGKFYSFVGFESFILSTLCVGMTHPSSYLELFVQGLSLGVLRMTSCIYLRRFHATIAESLRKKNKIK